MDSASIYPLLKHDYSDQPIYKKDLYNAKDSNLLWIVKLWLDPVSRKLKSLLWILPTQKELYNKYNNVTIIDTTYNTNRFQMMLCIIAIVDNNYKSRIVATAIIDNETLNTYRWLFNTILTEIAAAKYLSDTLYINKESWAISWIHKRFTTGAQSTQRIESINRHIHDKVDRATSLYDLLLNIKDHVRNEEHFEYFELERNAIPTIDMPMLNTRFLHFDLCREQEQDIQQILFKSLIKNIPLEAILELNNLSPISVCGTQTEDRVGMEKSITFQHFFSFRVDSHVSNLAIKSTKAIYAELFGLSKKAIDCALKANMQHELMNLLKSFIYDTHNKNVEIQETQETFTDINNPTITKHKGQLSKRFKSSVETKVAEETRRVWKVSEMPKW
ncbi:hypothetical protein RhiirB3_438224 [Rhizophagus irregularis]|nr:hypothetical protein RhiirB3_438224 [Rhizophagus irregularis]